LLIYEDLEFSDFVVENKIRLIELIKGQFYEDSVRMIYAEDSLVSINNCFSDELIAVLYLRV